MVTLDALSNQNNLIQLFVPPFRDIFTSLEEDHDTPRVLKALEVLRLQLIIYIYWKKKQLPQAKSTQFEGGL